MCHCLCVFHHIWVLGVCVWGGGGVPKELVNHLVMHFVTLSSSKAQVLET